MAEDLCEEDIVGLVFWFEPVATDGAVGASEVAGFPGLVQGAEGGGTYLGSCGPVVVLTAPGLGKLFNDRSRSASGQGHPGPCLFGGSGRWPAVREPFG
jgi:hypothetical protein